MQRVEAKIIDSALVDNRAYVKVEIDGDVLGGGDSGRQRDKDIDEKGVLQANERMLKVIKSSEESIPAVKATAGYAGLIGSAKHRIVSSENYGNFIVGPTTFTDHPENIRIGGVFRLNGLMTSTMPSTIITPIPFLVFDFPAADMLKSLAKISNEYTELIGQLL